MMSMEPTEQEEAAYEYLGLINAAHRVLEKNDELEDEIIAELVAKLVTFGNAHLVAERLIIENEDAAEALASELLFQIKE